MKQTTHYPHELKERGYVRADYRKMNRCLLEKSVFVEKELSAAVLHSDCGWKGVEYVLYDNGEEYVFFIDPHDRLSRGVCVTANSKHAIATAVFDSID